MTSREVKSLSVADLKFKLGRMGMSLDKSEHPKDYYVKMYLDKSNAKNKVTRNNTPFYKEQKNIESIRYKKGEESNAYEEEGVKKIDDDIHNKDKSTKNGKDYIYITNKKENINEKNDEIQDDSGIKTTRLIRLKQKKNINNKNNEEYYINSKQSSSKSKKINEINNNYNGQAGNIISHYSLRKRRRNDNLIISTNKKPKNKGKKPKDTEKKEEKEEILQVIGNNDEKNTDEEILYKNKVFNQPGNESIDQNIQLNEESYIRDNQNSESKLQDSESKISEDKNNLIKNIDTSTVSEVSSVTSSRYSIFSRFSSFSFGDIKNNIMNKCKKYIYLWPLLLLIIFGLIFFLNEKYEICDKSNIIIIFSIIMGLLLLYHLCKYFKEIRKFKKIAKEDKEKLLDLLDTQNINRESLAHNSVLLNNFIVQRIGFHNLTPEEYMNCVFPYLIKYLNKEGFILGKVNRNDNEKKEYWKEL